ncbi:hypothetical protein [Chlamydiifrater phoenicopteri]|uniref:hypothetical protein n=1 Tax=Chlamydiifrater phoenicopteri TaxID=2681469 RepID=UPI001BCE69A3|nr:hypothetical protein [Chlamydiifrater phoenicopteri]
MTANTFGTLDILMKYSKSDHLEQFLPEKLLIKGVHPQDIPLSSLSFNLRWLAAIHPSWIMMAMKEFPPFFQAEFLLLLPEQIVHKLQPYLPAQLPKIARCSDFGAFYLLDMLSKKIRPPGVTEEIFLPLSPFNNLLYYSMENKMTFIDCLGLFSIVKEMKNVVDKVVIKQIQDNLSDTEKRFLSYCRANPLKHLSQELFLHSWNGNKDSFRKFIHREGLEILALALVKEDASFLWHLLRRLDIGRAFILESALKRALNNPHSEYFRDRISQCMKVLVQ